MTQQSPNNDEILAVVPSSLEDLQIEGAQSVILNTERATNVPLTATQFNKVLGFLKSMTHGSVAAMPLLCKGEKCHPAGTLIKTYKGYKSIEVLDPSIDLLVSWDRPNNGIRGGWQNSKKKGYKFSIAARKYSGWMYTITSSSNKSYQCTHDHHITVRWTKEARKLFAVYLMRRGDTFRVGKVKLFTGSNNSGFGPLNRARAEEADSFWILGVYKTNTEALLAEEYFSCTYGIAKSCFISSESYKKAKHNGLYKWVTQEQLDIHHKNLTKDINFYRNMLSSLGLCLDHPFVDLLSRDSPTGFRIMTLNACNIINGYMECPTEEVEIHSRNREDRPSKKGLGYYKSCWEVISTSKELVNDIPVYSLEVEKYHHYIANGLVTHNCFFHKLCPLAQSGAALPIGAPCPIEQAMVQLWVSKHLSSLGITDPTSPTVSFDMDLLHSMAHQELVNWRAAATMSVDPEVVKTVDVGATPKGDILQGEVEHPAIKIMNDANRLIMKYREALLATRKSQIEAGQQAGDPSVRVSELVANARKKLALRQEQQQESIKDAVVISIEDTKSE